MNCNKMQSFCSFNLLNPINKQDQPIAQNSILWLQQNTLHSTFFSFDRLTVHKFEISLKSFQIAIFHSKFLKLNFPIRKSLWFYASSKQSTKLCRRLLSSPWRFSRGWRIIETERTNVEGDKWMEFKKFKIHASLSFLGKNNCKLSFFRLFGFEHVRL